MDITTTERLNSSIARGGKAYDEWNSRHNIPDYLSFIMYELLMRRQLTQSQLVDMSDLPKQSINKGIKLLHSQGYLVMSKDQHDKRKKFCTLTASGKKYAQAKMQPLLDLEEKTIQQMGMKKMQLLISLNDEWNQIFWNLLEQEER